MADNTGYLFYKKYYEGIDLRQFPSRDQKKVKERNSTRFEGKNRAILRNTPSEQELALLNVWKDMESISALSFQTTYPGLITGSGYIHETGSEGEFKLGCLFDHATGWPTISGSSVKGALRSFFPQFDPQKDNLLQPNLDKVSEKQKSKAQYIWYMIHKGPIEETDYKAVYQLEQTLFAGWDISEMKDKEVFFPMSSRVVFFDAVLDESMAGKTIFADDAITPHGKNALKNPIPLLFLKVGPGVRFNLYFSIPDKLFNHLDFDKEQILLLFETLIAEHGLGAKTNVGYGKLQPPPKPIVFEKGQLVAGKLIDKERKGNRFDLYFEIEGNPQTASANVKEDVYYNYEIGDSIKELKVSSVTPEGTIKYVRVSK